MCVAKVQKDMVRDAGDGGMTGMGGDVIFSTDMIKPIIIILGFLVVFFPLFFLLLDMISA